MNTDIRLDVGFLDHWKTDVLMSQCGPDGVLALLRLWIFAAQNKPDGRLTGITEEAVERIARWKGASSMLVACLLQARFLDKHDGVLSLHDWEDHNPYAATAEWRKERARKAAAARYSDDSKHKNATSKKKHASSMLQASYKHAQSMPLPSPSPSPSPSPEHTETFNQKGGVFSGGDVTKQPANPPSAPAWSSPSSAPGPSAEQTPPAVTESALAAALTEITQQPPSIPEQKDAPFSFVNNATEKQLQRQVEIRKQLEQMGIATERLHQPPNQLRAIA